MVEKKSNNLKLFNVFVIVLNVWGVSKFKPRRSSKLEAIIRCYSFTLTMIFLWVFCGNYINFLYTYFDSVTGYARALDRSGMVFISAGICCDATFRCKQDSKIFRSFDKIDRVLLKEFGVRLSYRKMMILNLSVSLIVSTPFFALLRQIFLLKMSTFHAIIYTIFVIGQLIVTTVKILHLLLVAQFLIRVKVIERLVEEKSDKVLVSKKQIFEKLFNETAFLVRILNDSFGFIALMNIGENFHC